MNETSGTFTPKTTTAASYTANGQKETSSSYSVDGDDRTGGLLITDDGYYIADDSGTRIIIGGRTADGINSTSVSWTPDTDIT